MERVSADLRKALAARPSIEAVWQDLTPIARRDFISWIEGAKHPETRARRIKKTSNLLAAGKRRPCCYSIVPMHLYKTLAASPKAKAQWKKLTPMERRDFVSWIGSTTDTEHRIKRAAALLTAGKRRPST